jgi:hypothetical protein
MAIIEASSVMTACPREVTWATPNIGTTAIGEVRMIP